MAHRSVDVVTLGPSPLDPYDPAATAWALAGAYAARGDEVRVLRPEGPAAGPIPEGVASLEVSVPIRRPGAAVDQAAYAEAAGRKVGRAVDLIVRDPSGLGALGAPGRTPGSPPLVAFVRGLELQSFDRERTVAPRSGWFDRLDTWRDRRSVRRLERAALSEADLLLADDSRLPPALSQEYALPGNRVGYAVPPVPVLPQPASRDAARGALDLPRDVPVAVTPTPDDRPDGPVVAQARETFRRIRPLFPGARLIVVGTTAPADPGVISVPRRDPFSFGHALAAANVGLFAGGTTGFDPMIVAAMRAGCAVAATPSVRVPVPAEGAIQYAPTDDPGDLASTLAELFADPALTRDVASRAGAYAERYLPERLVGAIDRAISKSGS
jgi:hypothetical protein